MYKEMGKTVGKKKRLVRQCKKPTTNYSKWKKTGKRVSGDN